MSILPNQNQGSNSSSSSNSLANPKSQHGNHHDRHLFQPQSLSRQIIAFGSLDISDSNSPSSPGPSLPAPQDSGGSSQEVTELGLADNNVMPNHERHSQSRSGGNGRGAGSYRSRGKRSGSQQSIGTVASHGSSPQPAGRRSQMMNGNHLLNFHYDPISRPQARGPPPPPARRLHKRKADNKDLFLQKYAKYVGLKRDFRLVVRGAARNMVSILNGSDDEVLIIKSVTHKDFNAMIKSIPNPVYLFQGIVLRRGAKGTGMKSIELALSMCDIVDMYGFTVDPGYTEWTRYFSTPRQGHNPLQGRAYYQLLECLGVIRIHSPMRSKRKQGWSDVPTREMIGRAHAAALRLKRGQEGDLGQFGSCKVSGTVDPDKIGPVSGSADMTDVRKSSNYSKWEVLPFKSLRKEAQDHYIQMEGVSLYKMDGNKLDDLVCVRHSSKSEV